jgi:flagellar basal body-associated protein FliL
MENTKIKNNKVKKIVIFALSILLTMSITFGMTYAWFASKDSADKSVMLGQEVMVHVSNASGTTTSGENNLSFTVAGSQLLPGMKITPNIAVTLQASTTATIMRARLTTVAANLSAANNWGSRSCRSSS